MRLRIGASMPARGGRSAIVAVEVVELAEEGGALEFRVGHFERVSPPTVEATRDRALALAESVAELRPCVVVDARSPQGIALRQALRGQSCVHGPHAFLGQESHLFAAFLQAYARGRVRFEPGIAGRAELDRALVTYTGRQKGQDGLAASPEDDALVAALGLAMAWPRHGQDARRV